MLEEQTLEKEAKAMDNGLIPSDWHWQKLKELASFRRGSFPQPYGLSKWYDEKNGTPFVQVFDVANNLRLKSETKQKISELAKSKSVFVEKGSIVLTIQGSIGRIAFTQYDAYVDRTLLIFTDYLVPLDKRFFMYMVYLLFQIEKQNAPGGTIKTITKDRLANFTIPLPPTKAEQTAIATALGDMDALIEAQEKLLAKKRLLKQGAMQELLKPKEGWVKKKLGEVATLKARIGWQGLTTAEYKDSGDYFLITGTDFKNGLIDWDNCHYVEYERYRQDKNIQVKEQDVLVTKDGTIGKIAFVRSVPKPATLNSGVFVIRPRNKSFDAEFFYHLLLSDVFSNFLSQLSAGSTINHLYQKDFIHFSFEVPKTTGEQQEIAQILSAMDQEIEQLVVQLEKYKLLKTGMMQDLLTGKKRLVKPAALEEKTNASREKPKKKKHNWQINEAVVIGVLACEFGSEQYPIGRKRYTKLSYLLHRYAEKKAEGYLKKAAGPYNPATRYKGPEKIALNNGYVREVHNGKYHGFAAGENISKAKEYFSKWYGDDALEWLRQFRYEKNDTLELWGTVDMAMEDLKEAGQLVNWQAVKQLIKNTKEWRPKLKRPVFSDENIQEAMPKIDKILAA